MGRDVATMTGGWSLLLVLLVTWTVAQMTSGCVNSPLQVQMDDGGSGDGDRTAIPDTNIIPPADGRGETFPPAFPPDPGRIPIHRLNVIEYAHTVKDLLGVTSVPMIALLPNDGTSDGLDNHSDLLGHISPLHFHVYFAIAKVLTAEVFADAALRTRIMSCSPGAGVEEPCAREIIRNFGRRAWRRPLDGAEVDRLLMPMRVALASGQDFGGAMRRVVTALLSSMPFLYHLEIDRPPVAMGPVSPAPRALTPYELASRLSYMVWRTMPDETLFALAASGDLSRPEVLTAQLDRLLADPRSQRMVEALSDNWLVARWVANKPSDPLFQKMFPTFDAALRDAMIAEAHLYLAEFFLGDRSFAEFLTADFNFVNAPLARHYGFPLPPTEGMTRVEVRDDQRRGYLGLASTLTAGSYSGRTSPTLRGVIVLDALLCDPLPPPPPEVDANIAPPLPSPISMRKALEEHNHSPSCNACHKLSDPIGLAFENFDAIGRYRTVDSAGLPIDVSALVWKGMTFDGPDQLIDIISNDPKFLNCPPQKLFGYAMRRGPDGDDKVFIQQLRNAWPGQGFTLRRLVKQIVLSDAFRRRNPEVP